MICDTCKLRESSCIKHSQIEDIIDATRHIQCECNLDSEYVDKLLTVANEYNGCLDYVSDDKDMNDDDMVVIVVKKKEYEKLLEYKAMYEGLCE